MTKKLSLITGLSLVLLGGLALTGNLVFPALGINFRWWQFWRLWPVIVTVRRVDDRLFGDWVDPETGDIDHNPLNYFADPFGLVVSP